MSYSITQIIRVYMDLFSFYPPGVNDVLLAASQSVAVEDEVTVSTVEVTVVGRIHGHLVTLNTPNLKARPQTVFPNLTTLLLSKSFFPSFFLNTLVPGLCPGHHPPCRAGLPWPCWSAGSRHRRAPAPLWLCCRWCRPYWGLWSGLCPSSH